MEQQGGSGRSARHYGDELAMLRGRLSDEPEAVRPSDYCEKCVLENRDPRYELCFHLHWSTPERGQRRETR